MDGRSSSKYIVASGSFARGTDEGPQSDHPDVQERVKQAIKQGHIAPEDFNGVSTAAISFPSTKTSS